MRAFQFYQVSRQIVLIIISILLAKSSLSAAEIGIYELLLYISYALTFFWISGWLQSALVQYNKLAPTEQPAFFSQLYLLFSGAAIAIFLLLNVAETALTQFFASRPQLPHFQLFSTYVLVQIPTFLVENFYLLKKANRELWIYAVANIILHLALVVIPVFLGYGLIGVIWGLLILVIIKHIWLLTQLWKYGSWAWKSALIKKIIILGMPLVGYAFISSFALTFDNWLVNWWYVGDAEQFAIFRYGARELPVVFALANAFSTAMLPDVSANLTQSLKDIKSKSKRLFHILFPISILGLLVSYPLFPLIFNETFRASAAIFNVYLLIVSSRLLFPHTIVIGIGEGSFMAKVSIIELIINVLASLIFVKYYGLVGIAFGTVIAYAFEKVAHVWYLRKYHQIRFAQYVDVKWFWGYTLILTLTYFLVEIYFS
ncbi:MAG: polysaccharide biosynthesis C-terminal domain-containing protein [Saprospiraceae bacterium]